jgi:type I restriction enzyme M protein
VIQWLTATDRLEHRPVHLQAAWSFVEGLRQTVDTQEALQLILVLLAVRMESTPRAWQDLSASAASNVTKELRTRVRAMFPEAEILLPRTDVPGESLAKTIAMISDVDRTVAGDALDSIFERAADTLGHRGGQYMTPRSIRRLIVALAGREGSLYNPGTGLGQLMVDMADHATSSGNSIYGQEINESIRAMARLNLAIHGVDAKVASGDVFSADAFSDLRADRVVAVPPWGQRLDQADELANDPRWVWGEPGPADGNAAWIQHCLYHLADDGRAVVVVPNRAMFEGGRSGRIRQRIIKAGLLDAVIALPAGLFRWTNVPCALLVFSKARQRDRRDQGSVLMIDIRDQASATSRRDRELSSAVIDEVSRTYRDWTAGVDVVADGAIVASYDQLAANDFAVDPGRYMPIDLAPEDPGDARRERDDLVRELSTLNARCRAADDRVAQILGVPR